MPPKTLFLSAFFLFASALCLRAQGTYEYGTVSYTCTAVGVYYLGISTGDNYVESKVKPKFDSKPIFSDLTLLLEKVNELAKDGWEVYSTTSSDFINSNSHLTYHLRRKKP